MQVLCRPFAFYRGCCKRCASAMQVQHLINVLACTKPANNSGNATNPTKPTKPTKPTNLTTNTALGYCMIALRLLTVLWFLSCLRTTWRRERSKFKRNFYLAFALFGVLYLVAYPVIVIVASTSPLTASHSTVRASYSITPPQAP